MRLFCSHEISLIIIIPWGILSFVLLSLMMQAEAPDKDQTSYSLH